jgi:hypothetical protein
MTDAPIDVKRRKSHVARPGDVQHHGGGAPVPVPGVSDLEKRWLMQVYPFSNLVPELMFHALRYERLGDTTEEERVPMVLAGNRDIPAITCLLERSQWNRDMSTLSATTTTTTTTTMIPTPAGRKKKKVQFVDPIAPRLPGVIVIPATPIERPPPLQRRPNVPIVHAPPPVFTSPPVVWNTNTSSFDDNGLDDSDIML